MKLGCCAAFDEYSIVAEAGFAYIELKGIEICSWSETELASAVRSMEKGPIRCEAVNGYCDARTPLLGPYFEPAGVQRYAGILAQRARQMGAKRIGVGAPKARTIPAGFSQAVAAQQFVLAMQIAAEETARQGIELLLEPLSEPCCNFLCYTGHAAAVVEKVNRPLFGLMVDFWHLHQMKESLEEMPVYLRRAGYIHLSGPGQFPRSYPLPEDKDILHSWCKTLFCSGYHGDISLEIGHPHQREQAAQSMRLIQRILEEEAGQTHGKADTHKDAGRSNAGAAANP